MASVFLVDWRTNPFVLLNAAAGGTGLVLILHRLDHVLCVPVANLSTHHAANVGARKVGHCVVISLRLNYRWSHGRLYDWQEAVR